MKLKRTNKPEAAGSKAGTKKGMQMMGKGKRGKISTLKGKANTMMNKGKK